MVCDAEKLELHQTAMVFMQSLPIDNQCVCSSLVKTISSALNIFQLSVVLSVELRPVGLPSAHFSISLDAVLVQFMYRQSYW